MSREPIVSEIVQITQLGIADTTIAYVTGTVVGKYKTDSSEYLDTLIGAPVSFYDSESDLMIGEMTDRNGSYSFRLPPSSYDVHVSYIAHNELVIKDLKLASGEIIDLNLLLGQSGGHRDSCVYALNEDRTIEVEHLPTKRKKR